MMGGDAELRERRRRRGVDKSEKIPARRHGREKIAFFRKR